MPGCRAGVSAHPLARDCEQRAPRRFTIRTRSLAWFSAVMRQPSVALWGVDHKSLRRRHCVRERGLCSTPAATPTPSISTRNESACGTDRPEFMIDTLTAPLRPRASCYGGRA